MPRLVSAKVIIFFVFLTVFDGAVLPVFQVHAVYPSSLHLFLCYTAFEWGGAKTVYVAFWVGLMRDFLGGGLIGVEASFLVILALALNFFVRKMERELPGIYLIVTFLFVFLAGILRLFVSYSGDLPGALFGDYLGMIVLTALYTSVLLPVFYFLADRWFDHSITKQYELFR